MKDVIKKRLARCVQLRRLGAPPAIVKNEQISLVQVRGLQKLAKEREELYAKHVEPLLEDEDD